ncbi:MAG: hypothetical protein ACKOI3_10750 [Actinomycetota bacterium]
MRIQPRSLTAATIDPHEDHRLAMALALLGLRRRRARASLTDRASPANTAAKTCRPHLDCSPRWVAVSSTSTIRTSSGSRCREPTRRCAVATSTCRR